MVASRATDRVRAEEMSAIRYDRGMWFLERLSLARLRRSLLEGVEGDVLEIGAGTGANMPFYGHGARLSAVDRHPERLSAAATKATLPVRPRIACADAQQLPFADASFDMVVGSLVFCSIAEPLRALDEARRVLRPRGRLVLLEHVRGLTPVSRRLTDLLHPLWFGLQGECHLNRETAATVAAAGFAVEQTSVHAKGVLQIISATAPDDGD